MCDSSAEGGSKTEAVLAWASSGKRFRDPRLGPQLQRADFLKLPQTPQLLLRHDHLSLSTTLFNSRVALSLTELIFPHRLSHPSSSLRTPPLVRNPPKHVTPSSFAMAPVQISEVKGSGRENRTAAHSHIKGLGLRSDGTAEKTSGGFIGQAAAREVTRPPPPT